MSVEEKLSKLGVHPSWRMHEYIELAQPALFILSKLKEQNLRFCPMNNLHNVFRVFQKDFNDVNVVILGQDPYPSFVHANGIAFDAKTEVKPKSLQIIQEAYCREINYLVKNFPDFEFWFNSSGVLPLNASLTCQENKVGSHKKYWQPFMTEVIKRLCQKDYVYWMLWGTDAKEYKKYIPENHDCVMTNHPSSVSYGYQFEPRFDLLIDKFPHLEIPF